MDFQTALANCGEITSRIDPLTNRTDGVDCFSDHHLHFQCGFTLNETTIECQYSVGHLTAWYWLEKQPAKVRQKFLPHGASIKQLKTKVFKLASKAGGVTLHDAEIIEEIERRLRLHYRPDIKDVILCLFTDATTECHSEWCANLGYDEDSIKAREIWLRCHEIRGKLERMFGAEFDNLQQLAWEV